MRRVVSVAAGTALVVTLAARLLTSALGGGGITLPAFPTDWGVTRYVGNPVIDVDNNPNETNEQYTPAPIRLPNGDIWIYVKGLDSIYAWKSTDDGETFALQNSNNPVISPGTAGSWDEDFTVEPAATYDPDTDTIHLYYKGTNVAAGTSGWGWGHATADGDTPTAFTKDAGNPILTSATVSTALGGGAVSDLSISDVVKIGSTFHFYGFAREASTYQIIQATGSDWDNPSGVESILSAPGGTQSVVQCPSVFLTASGKYAMLYSIGGVQLPSPEARHIRVAQSTDAETWDFSDTTNIISPTSGWESAQTYAGSVLKDGVGPTPVTLNGKLLYYYSGYDGTDANVGLAYMEPS